jgi:predicted phage terminase large subunit-like protein
MSAAHGTTCSSVFASERPRQVITTTPKPIKLLKEIVKRDGQDVVVTRGRTADNAANLAPSFMSQIVARYEGTRLGRQELNAELLEDVQGALWTRDLLEEGRRDKAPPMRRVVVAIDPAVSVSESADETGIIVAGLGVDEKGYVLEDASGKYSPIEWARRAVGLYNKHGADRIVAEANQGGLMVETTVRTVDANLSFKAVRASRGKITRAEPIAALFEQFRIHLVGAFPELEDQLSTFEAGLPGSPDRLDAMVWAFTELMVDKAGNTGFLEFYAAQAAADARSEVSERMIRVLAPPRIGAAQLLSGRQVGVPADRVVEMTIEDARPLYRGGWIRVSTNLLT